MHESHHSPHNLEWISGFSEEYHRAVDELIHAWMRSDRSYLMEDFWPLAADTHQTLGTMIRVSVRQDRGEAVDEADRAYLEALEADPAVCLRQLGMTALMLACIHSGPGVEQIESLARWLMQMH